MSDLEGFGFVMPHWFYWGWLAVMPLLLLALNAWWEKKHKQPINQRPYSNILSSAEDAQNIDPTTIRKSAKYSTSLTRIIDFLSEYSGVFVALWTINAVVFYFFEVIMRYVFNMPTIWVHEASFLLLGMQYVLAGAYALLHAAHVRVDVLYVKLPERGQVGIDIFTSVFFFAFALALTWTSFEFFVNSYAMNETTMETWGIQHWPVKAAMLLGGVLILLAGISKLIKDVRCFVALPDIWQHTGTYITVLASTLAALVLAVETFNIVYYGPFSDDYVLFRFAGTLQNVGIAPLTYIMFGSLFIVLMMGLPLAFVTGGLGVVFIYLVGDAAMLNIIPGRIFPLMANPDLAAIPLFIFMATMLERAGIIEELFNVVYRWMGSVYGGLAAATILASTVLAAMVGVIGAAVVTMGIIALPAMLKRRYNPEIALGSIMAGGTLGILIPPSILAILYAVVAQQSVGELYLGAVVPGILLSALYIAYVVIRCSLRPDLGPPVPRNERIGLLDKIVLLKDLVAPIVLIALVLGLLFGGVATPVEAAGIGSFGAVLVAMLHKKFNLNALREASITTAKAAAMVLWIMFGASIFVGFYILQGGQTFITNTILGTGLPAYGVLFILMILLVLLGMFLDWVGILLLAVPIFIPIIKSLSFDGLFGLPAVAGDDVLLWFGVLYLVNMQMSFLSPPFGYALFYIKGVCPPDISMATIFRSSLVFLGLQAVGLALCIVFPSLIVWLPNLVYG